jgi:hypothetical protein
MPIRSGVAVAALAALASACRHSPPAIDPSVASSIPAGTRALAGLNLDALRQSSLYAQSPQSARAALDFVPGASRLTLAWNGKDLLTLAEGDFAAAPSGFTLISSHLAAGGSADGIREAQTRRRTGDTGAPVLLAQAAGLAPDHAIWAAAAGDADLPLTGNFANLNRLLHYSRYTTAAARVTDRLEIEADATCADPGQARELEETLRAFASLLSAAGGRHSDLSAIWSNLHVGAHNSTVRATLSLSPEESTKALALLPR